MTPEVNAAFVEAHMEVEYKQGSEWAVKCPIHGERHASMRVNVEKGVYFCFAGDTEVITAEGTKPIHELSGKTVRLLTKSRSTYWVDAPVKEFGVQQIWNLTLTRNGVQKVIRTTAEHRWFANINKRGQYYEYTTETLIPGLYLEDGFQRNGYAELQALSPIGIQAGIVYGDGHKQAKVGAVVALHGEKDAELLKWFPHNRTWQGNGYINVYDMPWYFKDRPSLKESTAYLAGWLSGYFAADGSVDTSGQPYLESADQGSLKFAQDVATRIGVGTMGIKTYVRTVNLPHDNIRNGTHANMYRLTFVKSHLREGFFLLSDHRRRFATTTPSYERTRWKVVSVEATNQFEKVYCAVVPRTHNFVLADNIVTGNCHGCHARGGMFKLAKYLGVAYRYDKAEAGMTKLRNKLDLLRKGAQQEPEVVLSEDTLKRYTLGSTSYWTDPRPHGRGLSPETVEAFDLGYDPMEEAAVIPVRNMWGELLGVTRRNLRKDARIKYRDPKGFKKRDHLFGSWFVAQAETPTVVLTEGPLDCIKVWQAGHPAVAVYGSHVTERQIMLLRRMGIVSAIFMFDNDKAGIDAIKQCKGFTQDNAGKWTYNPATDLRKFFVLRRASYTGLTAKDPGDMTDTQIDKAVTHSRLVLR